MDYKTLKSDLTYAIKKLTKEGKTFTCEWSPLNLQKAITVIVSSGTVRRVESGDLFWEGSSFDALEALTFVKGYQYTPVKEVSDWVDPQGVAHHYEWFHHEACGLPLADIVSEQGQIAKTDIYDFMDGLENIAGNDKSEFYKVGVYIREKFTPVGSRIEKLIKQKYQEKAKVETVKKFVVHNRPMPGCRKNGLPSIIQVECEIFTPLLTAPGEFAARIFKPESLWEPTRVLQEGVLKDVNMPPVYCSHAIYDSLELAQAAAEQQIRGGFEFEIRKGRLTSYTEDDVKTKLAEVQVVMLP